jgi:hypothetical protein
MCGARRPSTQVREAWSHPKEGAMFANVGLHLRRLSSRRQIRRERLDAAGIEGRLGYFARTLPVLLNAEGCNIFVYDPAASKAWVDVGTGDRFAAPLKGTLVGEVIATGSARIANDLLPGRAGRNRADGARDPARRNAVLVPVRSRLHDEVVGVIEVVNRKDGAGFGADDLVPLQEAAAIVQDLVDAEFLEQKVYGATDVALALGRDTFAVGGGLVLLGALVAVLLAGAWSSMPVINDALAPVAHSSAPGSCR